METNTTSWWCETHNQWRGQVGRWSFRVWFDAESEKWNWTGRNDHVFRDSTQGEATHIAAMRTAYNVCMAGPQKRGLRISSD